MAGVDAGHVLSRRATAEAAILLALAGSAWLLYGSVLRLWWTHDDFFHYHFLVRHSPFWYFFDLAADRQRPVLTPLLFFSLDVDRRLFGPDPYPFFLHHLAALSLSAAALYGALRPWLSRGWSAVGAWLFLLGPAIASLVLTVMVRHYIEVIVFAALAVVAWAGAVRRSPGAGAWGWALLSAALYFAACMTKETAVPLFLLLPLLPPPSGSRGPGFAARARLALPHAAAFLLYVVLRVSLLDAPLGGYGFVLTPSGLFTLALELPGKLAAELVGRRLTPAAILLAATLAGGLLAPLLLRRWWTAFLTALALLFAMLPVLPVSTVMEPRYAAPAWIAVAIAFAAGCQALAASEHPALRRTAFALAAVACISGLWLNREDWSRRFAEAERMSAENRFFLGMKDGDVLRQPLTLAASLDELAWMKQAVYQRPPGGRWFQDDLYLCLHREPLGRVWGYDEDARRIVNLTQRVPALRTRYCSSIRTGAPLSATFRFTREGLFWELGPYREGTYRFILEDGAEAFEMPRSAGFKLPANQLPLRVEYESPEGWTTYSPELRLRRGSSVRWSAPSG